jgi:hypothetical protein
LLCQLLELVKTRYLGQISRESISDLIQELDALTAALSQESPTKPTLGA